MRGASESGLNGTSDEGKVKELAATVASICSIEDCMMLLKALNSDKTSFDSLVPENDAVKTIHDR